MLENMSNKLKVIALIGPSSHHYTTVATLLRGNVEVVGVVEGDSRENGLNMKFLRNAIKKLGFWKVGLQVLERLLYKLLNANKDRKIYEQLFPKENESYVKESMEKEFLKVDSYSDPRVLEFIKAHKPDLIVIHTPFWVPKKVRDAVGGCIIGAHPGMTQYFRGVHSPFWALYHGEVNKLGYTIFWVDKGVDSGDIICQGKIIPVKGDSYVSLSWKGMKAVSNDLVKILSMVSKCEEIKSEPNDQLSDDTIFYHPTVFDYIKYRFISPYR
ncbi:MAG: methionyl-tRNA formyltransferase [Algoriphagus sp.]|jgi:methionyl-tRNA formyltransferase